MWSIGAGMEKSGIIKKKKKHFLNLPRIDDTLDFFSVQFNFPLSGSLRKLRNKEANKAMVLLGFLSNTFRSFGCDNNAVLYIA